jgi:hypothetical protein
VRDDLLTEPSAVQMMFDSVPVTALNGRCRGGQALRKQRHSPSWGCPVVLAQLKLDYVLASACANSLRAAIPSFG